MEFFVLPFFFKKSREQLYVKGHQSKKMYCMRYSKRKQMENMPSKTSEEKERKKKN